MIARPGLARAGGDVDGAALPFSPRRLRMLRALCCGDESLGMNARGIAETGFQGVDVTSLHGPKRANVDS